MHESAVRLYEAAARLGLRGPSAIAAAINEAPQTVKNWETRGVSMAGAVAAELRFGCPASWIIRGEYPSGWNSQRPTRDALGSRQIEPLTMNRAVQTVAEVLMRLGDAQRKSAEGALQILVSTPDQWRTVATLLQSLAEAQPSIAQGSGESSAYPGAAHATTGRRG